MSAKGGVQVKGLAGRAQFVSGKQKEANRLRTLRAVSLQGNVICASTFSCWAAGLPPVTPKRSTDADDPEQQQGSAAKRTARGSRVFSPGSIVLPACQNSMTAERHRLSSSWQDTICCVLLNLCFNFLLSQHRCFLTPDKFWKQSLSSAVCLCACASLCVFAYLWFVSVCAFVLVTLFRKL